MLRYRKDQTWSRTRIAKTEEIIEGVRRRPFLYHSSFAAARRQGSEYGKLMEQWMEVAMFVYGRNDVATVDKVRKHWKTIRDGFVKYMRKSQLNTHLRPHPYASNLQFLVPYMSKGKSRKRTKGSNSVKRALNDSDSYSEPEIKKEELQLDQLIEEEEVVDVTIEEEEVQSIESFFEGVIQTVRKFKPSTVDRLKQAVANLIMDAEIEELEDNMRMRTEA